MGREKIKTFSKTEFKILVYNKMKKGMSHSQAVKEVNEEVRSCLNNRKSQKEAQKAKPKEDFKSSFNKLVYGPSNNEQ